MRVLGPINTIDYVAISGGIDSMTLLDFIKNGRHNPKAVFFDHKTENSKAARIYLEQIENPIIGEISRVKYKDESWEEYWRNERYRFFNSLNGLVATAHHLNDVAETYVFTMLNGNQFLIPYRNKCVVRPFLMVTKDEIITWAAKHKVHYINDKSNYDTKFPRNRIRHKMMPEILKINPGFLTVIKKKVKEDME